MDAGFHGFEAIGQDLPTQVQGCLERDVDRQVHHLLLEAFAVLEELLVPRAHSETHRLLLYRFAIAGIELDHGVHDRAVIVACVAVDLLLEAAQRTERLDAAAAQVELAFRDVAGVVGDGVRDVVARHGGGGQDRDRSRRVEINGLLVSRGELAVEVAGIPAV